MTNKNGTNGVWTKNPRTVAIEKHPLVVDAEARSQSARKALSVAEKELEGLQRLMDRTLKNQLDALEREAEQKNPLSKRRAPISPGKIEEHIRTARHKVSLATQLERFQC